MTRFQERIRAVLSLGSNIGERYENLSQARQALFGKPELSLSAASSMYETPPLNVGPEHRSYLNQVLVVNAQITSDNLMQHCQSIEHAMGREANGHEPLPRTIDIDLITFGDTCCSNDGLQLPHPRYRDRRFVLVPLVEIYPAFRDPQDGMTAGELLAACADESILMRLTVEGRLAC